MFIFLRRWRWVFFFYRKRFFSYSLKKKKQSFFFLNFLRINVNLLVRKKKLIKGRIKELSKTSSLNILEKNKQLLKKRSKMSKIRKMFKIFFKHYRSKINFIFFKNINLKIFSMLFNFRYRSCTYFFKFWNNWNRLNIKIYRSIKKRLLKKKLKKIEVKL